MSYARDEYDCYDYLDEEKSPEVKKLEKRMEHAADHMQGLIDELTGCEELDLNALYFHIGEICAAVGKNDEFGILKVIRNTKIIKFKEA